MNLGVLARAIRRHRYMQDRPAYRDFLQHVDAHGDAWKVPQCEVAAWWEARQAAALQLEAPTETTLRVSCPLGNTVVEIDGRELRIPPFEISVSSVLTPGAVYLTYRYGGRDSDFLEEVLGHLGYRHLRAASQGQKPDVPEKTLVPLIEDLRGTASREKRYGTRELDALRALFGEAHHRRGLPDLRLWSLPHRDSRPYRVGVSARYDVDKAIVNMPAVHELEARHSLRSTVYLRPTGLFYGPSEIRRYEAQAGANEIALHGEFVTTSRRFGDEFAAARGERECLETLTGREVSGVCMHGGELRTNTTPRTRDAIEAAGFRYETLYRNDYYLPLHLPGEDGVRQTLSIGQHFADTTVTPGPQFLEDLCQAFADRLSQARSAGGIFVPVLHPLYFDLHHYLRYPANLLRLTAFVPKFLLTLARMRADQQYANPV